MCGPAILCGLFDALEITELRLSAGALREGVLYEMEGRFRHQDIRQRTAQSPVEHYNVDNAQVLRVLTTMKTCTVSGRSRIRPWLIRSWKPFWSGRSGCMKSG